MKFLAKPENEELRNIYKSHSFIEYTTKTKLPPDFQKDDLSVVDIISEHLPNIHFGKPVPESYWYKPSKQRDDRKTRKKHNYEQLYQKIKERDSHDDYNQEIIPGKIYGRKEKPLFLWNYEQFKTDMFNRCKWGKNVWHAQHLPSLSRVSFK